jgi:hypothetical protein
MKKKIVFINQSSGYLMTDIVNAFYNSGMYEVALISGEIKKKETMHSSIQLSYIKKYSKKNIVDRTLSWIIATIQVWFLIRKKYQDYHVFLTSNPPTISFIASFIPNPYSALIYDLYPEGLVQGKFISENSLINKLWSRYNKKFFVKADNVFAITEGIAKGIKRYSPQSKINIIPVWCESVKGTIHSPQENKFIKKYHLEGKFIVMYSGNMGKVHDLEALVYLAEYFKDEKDIIFIFSGEGWKKQIINELVFQLNLQNCLILPYQSKDIFSDFLFSAHIGVVSVAKGAEWVCIPSKTYNLLAYGIPILGITENFSDLSRLIRENHVGESFTSKDIAGMAAFVQSVKEGKENQYSRNAFKVSEKFTSDNAFRFLDYSYN